MLIADGHRYAPSIDTTIHRLLHGRIFYAERSYYVLGLHNWLWSQISMRTHRTFEASITNPRQVSDDLDQLGRAASKLWNVGRYYTQEQWDETGEIPDDGELKSELKGHNTIRTFILNPVSAFSKNSLKR